MTIVCKPHSAVKLELVDHILSVDYQAQSDKAIFDICSVEGRILHTGEFNGSGTSKVDVSELESGYYNLYIVDGDKIHKKQFMLAF